ncbi:MAG: type 2 lantipeptide synthetase LanM [Acidobacteria bacterium]|nr:type 2 lantipeptide synthetase LanM [Acidobacteriota bacterium]MCA1618597.1 type 2 lantipeptide synthetase LanM [Acidobacteriota bacterium]
MSSYDRDVKDLSRAGPHAQAARNEATVSATSEKNGTANREPGKRADAPEPDDCEPLSAESALSEASRLGERLAELAIDDEVGVTWAGFGYAPESGEYRPYGVGFDLHSGSCGVALFLAALERVTGGAGFRPLALGALRPFRDAPTGPAVTPAREPLRGLTVGGLTGAGSVIYTLARASLLLDEPALLEDARKLAARLTPDGICEGASFDVTDGAAGALLGLLTLHEAAGDPHALDLAQACGLYLLDGRARGPGGQRVWPTYEGRLLTGFSHGAAGIAYALLRLAGATGDRVFREAASEAIGYERSVYDAGAKNWPDYRVGDRRAFSAAWCHGAPGIGLARLGGLALLDTPDIRADIEAALETTLQLGLRKHDHLCCGTLGTAEVLLEGGLILDRPQLVSAARRRASFVLERVRASGAFLLPDALPEAYQSPGFFVGLAGVGYELLRLSFPEQLPSVLRLE